MPSSADQATREAGLVVVVAAGPLPAPLGGPLAALRRAGIEVLVRSPTETHPDSLREATADALLLVADAPDEGALARLTGRTVTGPPLILLVPRLPKDFELEALARGAAECLALEGLDPAALDASIRRAGARWSHIRQVTAASELFHILVERDPNGVAVLEQDFTIRYVSNAGARVIGLAHGEVEGRNLLEFLEPDDFERLRSEVAEATSHPGVALPTVHRVRHSDGTWREIEGTIVSLLDEPAVRGQVIAFRDSTTSRRKVAALLAEEERFRSMAEHAPVMMWTEDAKRDLLWENTTALEFVGRTLAEEAGGGWLEAVHPDDRDYVREQYRDALAEQRNMTLEFRLRRHDGVYRQILQIAIPRWDAAGRLSGFLGVDVDVTELKERSDRVAEAEERYRQIAEAVPVIVWMDDAAHHLTYQNRTAEHFSGRDLTREAGTGWFEGIHPADRARVEATYQESSAHPAPYQHTYRLRRADGAYRWVIEIGVPRVTPEGELQGFVGVDVDIHDLMSASSRLEQAETRYRNFIEHSTEGIWRFESATPIPLDTPEDEQVQLFLDHSYLAECNVAMAEMYGYQRPEEMANRRLREFAGADTSAMEEFLRAYIRSGYRLTDAETVEQDRHGRTRHFLNNLVGIVEHGSLTSTWGTQRDITERRHLEEEARQARKMETAGRLAGGVAHDFNNLLTAILGTSELLLQELPSGSSARADVEEIKRAATRAANLTRQLLAFSRRQVLQPRILDLNHLVHGVETMLHRLIGEHITLVTHTTPDLHRVRADPGQIEQVIVNLCVNARDAMPTGGTLRIETANVHFPGASHGPESVMPPGEYVLLTVTDSGVGMEPETLRHLFEPFYTTKAAGQGTGLGLATVYGIVKQSGGFIYVESAPSRGAKFRIYLPPVEGDLEPQEPPAALVPQTRGEGTILVVEDEEAVRRLARRALEGVGYRVLEAGNGNEALRLADRWQDAIDLVITDVIMPGMSGQELSARLRMERPWLKILYVSGYTDDTILQHGTLLPNTAFLHKPFSPASLAQRVHEVLGH
jgi:PAS domain S-box-containing protein